MLKIFQKSMRACLAAVLVCLLALTTNAQNKTVTGKVTDAKNGSPLVGATVSTKPSGNATATKSDGSFSLSVKPGVTKLVISFTGYGDKEIAIDASGVVNLTMEPNAEQLQDVVVVGYGTRKLKDATGSVSSIGPKSFNKGVISSPENLFQGKIAGVTVTTASGEPGGSINVVIRGTSSIRSNNNPLFVVDGVPLSGGGTTNNSAYGEGGTTARNPLSFLNPNDIENISVLKDASSAAIYGARGANGVILITTKNGRGANSGFNVGYNISSSKIASRYDLANAQDFVWGVRTALQRSGLTENDIQSSVSNIDKGYSTDWQDQIFQVGVANNLNLSWGKSTKKTSIRLSGSIDDQQGIVKTSGLTRNAFRLNLDHNFTSKLKLNLGVAYSTVKNAYAGITNNAGYQGSLIGATIAFNPTYPVYNEDGTFFDPNDGNRNPVMLLNYFKDNDEVKTLIINAGLTYNITKSLSATARVGIENITTLRQGFADPRINNTAFSGSVSVLGKNFESSGYNGNGRGIKTNVNAANLVAEYFLSYDKNFKNSNLNVIGGFSYQNTTNYINKQQYWGLENKTSLNTDFSKFKNYTPIYSEFGDSTKYELQSYYARANYTILDKYLFTATVRIDGSSRFGKNNKYGTFPAFAFKWKILNEKFAQGATKIFDNLDLRVNYGLTGNQEIGSYASLLVEETNFNGSKYQKQAQNPNVKWEATTTTGFGVDFSFLNGRIRGNVDYYNKVTKDLLFLKPYFKDPYVRYENLAGTVTNNGFEFGLDILVIKPVKNNGFSWSTNFNAVTINNNVTDLDFPIITGEVSGQGLTGAYAQTIENGQPIFSWKMPTFVRFDGNGNGVYANGGSDVIQGSALPNFTWGLTNNFTLHNFTLSIFLNAQSGFYIYNNTANALLLEGSLKTAHNVTYNVINSNENPINPGNVSSRFLEKGDFVRLQNVNLSYAFNIKKTSSIKSLVLSASAQNLALFTNYSGLDPEVNVDKNIGGVPSRGFDYTAYPKARTFTLGINIGF